MRGAAVHAARRLINGLSTPREPNGRAVLAGLSPAEKARLIRQIVKDRGWDALTVSTWVIAAAGRTNRARIAAHHAVLRAAFPADGRAMRAWLSDPSGPISALSMWTTSAARSLAPRRRVRRTAVAHRGAEMRPARLSG